MALNPEGVFDRHGYLGQARKIISWLEPNMSAVLELACGNGFNIRHLAHEFPAIEFTGIDIVFKQLKFASKRSLFNSRFIEANFQELPFNVSHFDLVYVIESLCHATDMSAALAEAYRVLRPKGVFIVIDAWRTRTFDELPDSVQKAADITQQAMAVGRPWRFDEWLAEAMVEGFELIADEDLTSAIMPNLHRFEDMATRYFSHPRQARLWARLAPTRLVENAIAGYLMPLTVGAGAHTYRMVVLRRS